MGCWRAGWGCYSPCSSGPTAPSLRRAEAGDSFAICYIDLDNFKPFADTFGFSIADMVIRLCAVCDGYEANDHRIAVYGPPSSVIAHAGFLRTYSRSVTLVARVTTVALALREDRPCQQRAVDTGRQRTLVCYGEP